MPFFNRESGKGGRKARGVRGGRGRQGGQAAGPGGVCICVNPDCRHEQPHQRGQPCYQQKCPKCGSPMTRK